MDSISFYLFRLLFFLLRLFSMIYYLFFCFSNFTLLPIFFRLIYIPFYVHSILPTFGLFVLSFLFSSIFPVSLTQSEIAWISFNLKKFIFQAISDVLFCKS